VEKADRQLEGLGIALSDLDESYVRSQGPGGQNVNKVETAVRLLHGPSGLEVKAQSHRSQLENRVSARRRLAELYKKEVLGVQTKAEKRSEKVRGQKARQARRRRQKALRKEADEQAAAAAASQDGPAPAANSKRPLSARDRQVAEALSALQRLEGST